jgi:hypothetical protein
MRETEFSLASTFGISDLGNEASSKICIWSPHPKVEFIFPVFEDSRDAIRVCVNDSASCQTPLSLTAEGKGVVSVSPAEYIEIDADNQRFTEKYDVLVRARRLNRFFDSADSLNSKKFEFIKVAKREERNPELGGAPIAIEAKADRPAGGGVVPLRSGGSDNSVQIASIFIGGIVCIGSILYWAGTRPLHRRSLHDEAETHLLPRTEQSPPQYPIPYGQPFYQQPMPYQTFPLVAVPQ